MIGAEISKRAQCVLTKPSPQLRVFGLGLLQDGDVGVGVFPQREEIIVGGALLLGVARSYDAEPALRPTSFWNSGSSCRQSRSGSSAAQFGCLNPAANAFVSVSSASAFFPRTP
jgi:hypothetical protein